MPTEVIQIPAGTYNLAGGGSRTVTTLTVTEPGGTLNVGSAYTPTTNATNGATWSIRRNGVEVDSGIVGTDPITWSTTGYTAGDVMTCRVISGAQDVTSAGKTLSAPSLVYRVARGYSNTTSASSVSFTTNLSEAQAGDKVILIFSSGATAANMHTTCTIDGVDIGAASRTDGTANNLKTFRVWQYTMPSSGAASIPIAFSGGAAAQGDNHLAVIIIAGGAVASATVTSSDGSTGLSANITPANAENIIFAVRVTVGSMGTFAWTAGVTQAFALVNSRIAGGYAEDATSGVALTVSQTNSTSRVGSLYVISVEPA